MPRILLVAPLDPKKPGNLKFLVGGENTYTRTLLKYHPKGVKYVHFEDALMKGSIEYLPVNKILWLLVKFRILPVSSGSRCLKLNTSFDLIHSHAFSIKIVPSNIPIVLSDSSSNYLFLRDYLNWPIWRIRFGYFLRRRLFRLLGVIDPDVNMGKAKKLIVFSKFAYKIHQKLGIPKEKMKIIHPGLESRPRVNSDIGSESGINILFVGIWFERKGGHLLLEAFKRLSKKYKNISLTVIGEVPKNFKLVAFSGEKQISNFKFYDYVPRERLIREFFPKADIFVLIPPKVEGFGFSVLEAMSFGIPVILSRVCALPELVVDGKSGFVIKPGSIEELTDRLEILIENSVLRKRMGRLARIRFEEKFSIEKSNENLLKVYRQALL